MKIEWIGWVATAAFASSYLFKEPRRLRLVQAAAALLWVAYGVIIEAMPVIVANVVVAGVAVGSILMAMRSGTRGAEPGQSN